MSFVLFMYFLPMAQDEVLDMSEAREHPGLFITLDDVQRARAGSLALDFFANEAESLLNSARDLDPDTLPEFEDTWWADNRERPWRETYPEINHLTGQVPRTWTAAIQRCARASLLYPDEGLDVKAREMLLSLSDYHFEYEHFDVGMNYTTWGMVALEAYDILYAGFSQSERARMDAFFDRMLAAVRKNNDYWIEHEPGGPMNNHYAWHYLGMMMYGLFYGDDDLVQNAIHGAKGPIDSLLYGFRDDGLWLEASINYQFAATVPLVIMAELLENVGHSESLWNFVTDDGHSLRQSYNALIETMFPDGTMPNIGDCYGRRTHPGSSPDYEILYRRFNDPTYAWAIQHYGRRHPNAIFSGIPELPAGNAPLLSSRNWPEQGYTMLRSAYSENYWSGDGWTLFTTWSGAPVHDNRDKLSFMLFADGHHWLVDAEVRPTVYHAFSAAVQSELNRHTLSHNTVMVDGQSQRHPGKRLELVEYQILPEVQRVTMADRDGRLYPGVQQMRTFLISDAYILDVFQVKAETTRNLTWLLHVDGKSVDNSGEAWMALTPWAEGPKRWLREPESAPLAGQYHEVFQHESDHFTLDVHPSSAETTITRCLYPRDDRPDSDAYATRMIDVDTNQAIFLAVYRRGTHEKLEELTVRPASLGRLEVTVNTGDAIRHHLIPALMD